MEVKEMKTFRSSITEKSDMKHIDAIDRDDGSGAILRISMPIDGSPSAVIAA